MKGQVLCLFMCEGQRKHWLEPDDCVEMPEGESESKRNVVNAFVLLPGFGRKPGHPSPLDKDHPEKPSCCGDRYLIIPFIPSVHEVHRKQLQYQFSRTTGPYSAFTHNWKKMTMQNYFLFFLIHSFKKKTYTCDFCRSVLLSFIYHFLPSALKSLNFTWQPQFEKWS